MKSSSADIIIGLNGSLNLRRAETPEMAFWRKIPEEYYYGLAVKSLGW